jgi:diguanylate cyclase (GGDEF)-like protein/PAS domain S-box-containing protein
MIADNDFKEGLLNNISDAVYFVDTERKITYWNKAAEKVSGYKAADVTGKRCRDNILIHVNEQGNSVCSTDCPLEKTIRNGQECEAELYILHKEGYRLPVLIRSLPLKDNNNNIIGAIEIFRDNSEKVAYLQRIEKLENESLFDDLTGLANRRYANIILNKKLNEFVRYGWQLGVMFVDIDRFKPIIDVHGQSVGEEVIKMVAKTMLKSSRVLDTPSRWEGAEFVGIISNVRKEKLYSIANRLRVLTEKSILFKEKGSLKVTLSIGATLAKLDDTEESLIARAEQMMYQSKTAGRNCVSLG